MPGEKKTPLQVAGQKSIKRVLRGGKCMSGVQWIWSDSSVASVTSPLAEQQAMLKWLLYLLHGAPYGPKQSREFWCFFLFLKLFNPSFVHIPWALRWPLSVWTDHFLGWFHEACRWNSAMLWPSLWLLSLSIAASGSTRPSGPLCHSSFRSLEETGQGSFLVSEG